MHYALLCYNGRLATLHIKSVSLHHYQRYCLELGEIYDKYER